MYVRGVEGAAADLIDSATFSLSSVSSPVSVTVASAPFEFSRVTASQPYTVHIHITFRDNERPPADFVHTLSFGTGAASTIIDV